MKSRKAEPADHGGLEPKSCELTGPMPDHPDLVVEAINGNWVKGTFKGYEFEARIYANPSHWGIHDGRISKLQIFNCKDGVWLQKIEEPKAGATLRRYPVIFGFDRGGTHGTVLGGEMAEEFAALFSRA